MTATFLVEIDVDAPDPATLGMIAGDIQEVLEADGFTVHSAKAWTRTTLPSPQTQQTTNQQTNR